MLKRSRETASSASQRRGSVLIFVVGALALMAALAATFMLFASLERTTASNFVNLTRSRIVAESGVEYAISRLLAMNGQALTAVDLETLRYEPGAAPGMRHAVKSSFPAARDARVAGYCGAGTGDAARGAYADYGDAFVLRVTAEDGKLNLNDSNGRWKVDTDPTADYPDTPDTEDVEASRDRLFVLIENLADALFNADGEYPALGWAVADTLMSARASLAGGTFSSLREVESLLVGGGILTAGQFERFAMNVTLYSWQDPHVIRPTWTCELPWPEYLEDYRALPQSLNWDVYRWRDMQPDGYELEPRSPINVNLASAELLEAVIRPLQGWYLREGPGSCQSFELRGLGWLHGTGWYGMFPPLCYAYNHSDWKRNTSDRRLYDREYIPMFGIEDGIDATGDKAMSRLGQAFCTPPLESLQQYPDLAKYLAQALHERIHASGNPIETWEEMEAALGEALDSCVPPGPNRWGVDVEAFTGSWYPRQCPCPFPSRWEFLNIVWNPQKFYKTQAFGSAANDPGERMPYGVVDTAYVDELIREIVLDLLLAQFNPNSRLNSYNPDRHLYRHIDKSRLTRYSTELSLQTCGTYRIDSFGMIRTDAGACMASTEVRTVVELARPFRLTTQAQFMRGFESPEQFSPAPADGIATAWNTRVLSYPEPLILDNEQNPASVSGAWLAESRYDGCLSPSPRRASAAELAGSTLYAGFQGTLKAVGGSELHEPRFVDAPSADGIWSADATYHGYRNNSWEQREVYLMMDRPARARLTRGDENPSENADVGILHPDGALSDLGRSVCYPATAIGSNGGRSGAVQFYFKPNFNPAHTTRIRSLFNMSESRWNRIENATWKEGIGNHPQVFGVYFLPHYGPTTVEMPKYPVDIPTTPSFGMYDRKCWQQMAPCSLNLCVTNVLRSEGWYQDDGRKCAGPSITDMEFAETYITSPTVVRRFPNQVESQRYTHDSYNMEARQWSHAVIWWDIKNPTADTVENVARFELNGRNPMSGTSHGNEILRTGGRTGALPWHCYIHERSNALSNGKGMTLARFGGTCYEPGNNYVADCTYDEIVGYATSSVPVAARNHYRETGRYYCPQATGQEAMYQSPVFDLHMELALPDGDCALVSVAWTTYWPKSSERRNYLGSQEGTVEIPAVMPVNVDGDAVGDDGVQDDPLVALRGWNAALDPVSLDIAHVARDGQETWLADTNENPMDERERTLTYAGGTRLPAPIRLEKGEGARLRVYFNQKPGQVTHEAPALDDVTLFLHVGVIMLWQEVLQ